MMKAHVDLNTSRGAGKWGSGETNQCNHRRKTKDTKSDGNMEENQQGKKQKFKMKAKEIMNKN